MLHLDALPAAKKIGCAKPSRKAIHVANEVLLSLGDLPTPHSATRNHKLKSRDPICSRSLVMQGVGITLQVKIYDLEVSTRFLEQ